MGLKLVGFMLFGSVRRRSMSDKLSAHWDERNLKLQHSVLASIHVSIPPPVSGCQEI